MVFEQLSLIYSLPRYLVRSFRLILPFFPTGTMERIDTEGQVSMCGVCGRGRFNSHDQERGKVFQLAGGVGVGEDGRNQRDLGALSADIIDIRQVSTDLKYIC